MKKQYKNSNYEIYSDGKCYSNLSKKFLTPSTTKYPTYNLTLDGKKKKVYIHRMVAESFLPKVEGKNLINHKDGNTKNYNLSNLEWVTPQENAKHALANGLTPIGNQTINRFISNLDGEEWREIDNFPLYLISNYGRVMNHKTKRLLKPALSNHGYLEVSLWKNNKGITKQIHQLVYQNFSQDKNLNGYVINHKDGIKTNNSFYNLEKVTYSENNYHATYVIKTNKSAKPVQQLNVFNNLIEEFPSIAEASRKTNIKNISRAIKTKRMAGGYYWKFKENN